ncbi:MAG TPA: hypothetical protein VGR27_12870 [Longimicrobiaceae bacterium]|nr:hypothetical protein [Longimicrobiaceae bacterium]
MARGPKLLEDMRRSKSGWGESDFFSILEYYGYELERQARHGSFYRHPLLASHPDIEVRRNRAQIVIPKGRQLREYVAEKVVASIDTLLAYQKELDNG